MQYIIDSHQHFWDINLNNYPWLKSDNQVLYRNYLPKDLVPLLRNNKISATVVVQASPTVNETKYLLNIAKHTEMVKAVVGWIDLSNFKSIKKLQHLSKNTLLKGLRPMLQDINDYNWINNQTNDDVMRCLSSLGLSIDLLINSHHISSVIKFIEKWPNIPMVINHFAKPNIDENHFQTWSKYIYNLSIYPNVYAKMSGLLTQTSMSNIPKISDYFDYYFEIFGVKRIMWGSDWPVLKLNGTYKNWLDICTRYIINKYSNSFDDVFFKVARDFYKIEFDKTQ